METTEPRSWAGAMLKHVREQQKQQIKTDQEPEQTITIAQLIKILAIIGNYQIDINRK